MDNVFGTIISGDSHVMEPSDLWEKAIGQKLGDKTPRVVGEYLGQKGNYFYSGAQVLKMGQSDAEAQKIGMQAAGWDPVVRLEFQKKAKLAAEMMNATRMLLIMQHPDHEALKACAAVFNDWLAEFCAHDKKRLHGVSMIPMGDIDWAIKELERTVARGLRCANIHLQPPVGAPPYRDKVYDRFWARAQEMDIPLQLHIITGRFPDPLHFHTREEQENSPQGFVDLFYEIMGVLANEFIFGKILDRFPRLKIICSEFEISWIPNFMWRLDQMQEAFAARLPLPKLDMRASDYVKKRMWHGVIDDEFSADAIRHLGADHVIWGSDFPHVRSIGLDTQGHVSRLFKDFSPDDQAKLVGGSAIAAYNLPN